MGSSGYKIAWTVVLFVGISVFDFFKYLSNCLASFFCSPIFCKSKQMIISVIGFISITDIFFSRFWVIKIEFEVVFFILYKIIRKILLLCNVYQKKKYIFWLDFEYFFSCKKRMINIEIKKNNEYFAKCIFYYSNN
jgi:hypothetical protein